MKFQVAAQYRISSVSLKIGMKITHYNDVTVSDTLLISLLAMIILIPEQNNYIFRVTSTLYVDKCNRFGFSKANIND